MISKRNLALIISAGALSLCAADEAVAGLDGHEIGTKLRMVHFDRDYGADNNDREQTALAVEANYTSPQFADLLGIALSGYLVKDLGHSGIARTDILEAENGELDGFSLIGQAYFNVTPTENSAIKIGRQKHKSMLLSSSGSRAVPNTFSGVSANAKPADGLLLYGAMYDKWSPRASNGFDEFATDQSAEGAIDYIGILGAIYQAGAYTLEGEYLTSKDYLGKLGIRGS
jgi:hypothetical protein